MPYRVLNPKMIAEFHKRHDTIEKRFLKIKQEFAENGANRSPVFQKMFRSFDGGNASSRPTKPVQKEQQETGSVETES